jgi:hypothetical protein
MFHYQNKILLSLELFLAFLIPFSRILSTKIPLVEVYFKLYLYFVLSLIIMNYIIHFKLVKNRDFEMNKFD